MGAGCAGGYEEKHRAQPTTYPSPQKNSSVNQLQPQLQPKATSMVPSSQYQSYTSYAPQPYPSINQQYNGVIQAPIQSNLPPHVGSVPQTPPQFAQQQQPLIQPMPFTPNKVDQGDLIKAKLKFTRDRVNNLIAKQESDIVALDQQILQEKANGLKNKPKVKFLLKQRKDFIKSVEDLRTRQQVVQKTVNDLTMQHLDKNIIEVLDMSNQHMQQIQDELDKKNWREVLVASQQREDIFQSLGLPEDNEVDMLYADLERQVIAERASIGTMKAAGQVPQLEAQQAQVSRQPPQLQIPQVQPQKLPQQPSFPSPPNFIQQRPMVPGVPFVESFDQQPVTDSMHQFAMGAQNYSNIPLQMQQQQTLQRPSSSMQVRQAVPLQNFQPVVIPPLIQSPPNFVSQPQQQPMLS